jgi:anti-sigma factor RsiW
MSDLDQLLRDHARIPAPPALRAKLERRWLGRRRAWLVPALSALAGAAVAAALLLLVLRPGAPAREGAREDIAAEAASDHLRVLVGRDLGVVASDMHQVKPWFAGKLEFTPPLPFLGDEEFPLRGGDVAVFLGHKAAEVVFTRRLHVISLFVFEGGAPTAEHTIRGFHVATWTRDGFGCALVSDVGWDDLRALRERLTR